jgi:RNA polymerase subunit RPABC4/transcription elongation factor Spt4
MRACKTCTLLTELEVCPTCKIATTQYWSGYVGVIHPDKSEIAKKLNLDKKAPGEYALKVR